MTSILTIPLSRLGEGWRVDHREHNVYESVCEMNGTPTKVYFLPVFSFDLFLGGRSFSLILILLFRKYSLKNVLDWIAVIVVQQSECISIP